MDPIEPTPAPNMMTPPVQTPPVVPASMSPHNRPLIIMTIVGAIVLLLAVAAYATGIWPFSKSETAMVSPSPSASASPMETANPMAGWKTYTNIRYAYEIKYPASAKIAFYSADGSASVGDNASNARITVADQAGCDGSCGVNIIGSVPEAITTSSNAVEVNQILSTFKFTTADPTAGWKTYVHKIYGFELNHPDSDIVYSTATPLGEEFRFPVGGGSTAFLVLKVESTTFCNKWGSNYQSSGNNPCKAAENPLRTQVRGTVKYSLFCVTEGGMGPAAPLTSSDKEICKEMANTFTLDATEAVSSWKIYRNTIYGIEFKYPSGLCLKEGPQEQLSESSGLGLFLEDCPTSTYDPYNTRRYLKPQGPEFIGVALLKSSQPLKEQLDPSAPREQIVKNGISGYFAPNTMYMERTGLTFYTSRWMFLSPTGYSIYFEDKPEITEKILSTFKFTK